MRAPRHAEAMKATLTDERFGDPEWIFERKLDGIRCIAIRDGGGRAAAVAQRPRAEGRFPEVAEALEAQPNGGSRSTARSWPSTATRRASAARRGAGSDAVRVYYYVFDVLWLDGEDVRPLPLRERKQLLRDTLDVRRPAALHRAPQRARRGVLRGGVPQGLGGADRQARRQPVRRRALAGLAQVQVRARPGAGDRRLHRAQGEPERVRRATHGLLRGRRPALRGQGRHGLRPPAAAALGGRLRALRRDDSPFTRRDPRARRDLGRAGACRPDRLRRMDPGRPPAPSRVPRAPGGQGPATWCARDHGEMLASAAATSRG